MANAANQKTSAWKSIFTRNVILILLIQLVQGFSSNMVGGFVGLEAKGMGLTAAFIGICASLYTFGGLLMRAPAGLATDTGKKRLVLVGALFLRSLVFLLYGFCGKSSIMYAVLRTLHGFTWSFVGVALPAVMAMMVDKKIMGTTYAVFSALNSFSRGLARPLAMNLYKNFGSKTVALVTFSVGIASVLLALCLDFNDPNLKPARVKKASINPLNGIAWRFVPLCAISCLAIFAYQADNVYTPLIAEERGLDITAALAIGAGISTVWSLVVGVLCDIINTRLLTILLLTLYGIGTVMIGRSTSAGMFFVCYIIFIIGSKYGSAVRIEMMKNAEKSEQGAVSATNLLFNDIYATIAGTLIGVIATKTNYETAFIVAGALPVLSAVVFIFFGRQLFPKKADTSVTETAAV